jgi:plastocyanin
MKLNRTLYLSGMALLALLLAACSSATPTPSPTELPLVEDPQANESSVLVDDQDASAGFVVIEDILAAQAGWIVIHISQDGAPGPIIGFAPVNEGENQDIKVEIELSQATEDLFAMLHIDAGVIGEYEFPGDDGPARNGDTIVNVPFKVTLPMEAAEPSVSVSDQAAQNGTITISQIVAHDPSWIVIHTEADGAPGPIIGFAPVVSGRSENVEVEIDLDAATSTLFAMLHVDAGTLGEYEFPGDDVPVRVNDVVVNVPFTLQSDGADTSEEVKVMVVDSSFQAKEITVPVGTSVIWEMSAGLPHTVTSDAGLFDSGRMSDGETFTFTFTEAGEFPYYCQFHGGPGGQGMAGTVIVTGE